MATENDPPVGPDYRTFDHAFGDTFSATASRCGDLVARRLSGLYAASPRYALALLDLCDSLGYTIGAQRRCILSLLTARHRCVGRCRISIYGAPEPYINALLDAAYGNHLLDHVVVLERPDGRTAWLNQPYYQPGAGALVADLAPYDARASAFLVEFDEDPQLLDAMRQAVASTGEHWVDTEALCRRIADTMLG